MAQNKPVAQLRKVIDGRLDKVSAGLIIVKLMESRYDNIAVECPPGAGV